MTTTSDCPVNRGDAHILPHRPIRQTFRSQSDPMAGASSLLESQLVPEPRVGRVYRSQRTIRLADVAVDGRLRLDAMARYMQDIASDDVADAKAEDELLTWVVRRTLIDVVRQFRTDQAASLATWASGAGSHWAARRTTIAGDAGGHAEAESIWVLLDRATGRPARLPLLSTISMRVRGWVGRCPRSWSWPPSRTCDADTGALAHSGGRHRHPGARQQCRLLGGDRERAAPSVTRERRRLGAYAGCSSIAGRSISPQTLSLPSPRAVGDRRLVHRRRRHRSSRGDSPRRLKADRGSRRGPPPSWRCPIRRPRYPRVRSGREARERRSCR